MTKTVNRAPKYFDPSDVKINEKYFNFNEFGGLCDNKNYLGIDQTTFEEVNNMYVNQDGQLSSRPPIKQIDITFANEIVIKVYKINNVCIYHTKHVDTNLYYIHFKYNETWYSRQVTQNINCCWWNTRFVVFTESTIFGFSYNYDSSIVVWYDVDAMLYIPISEIVQGGVKTSYENENELTTKKIIRYIVEYGIPTLTSDMIGKQVQIAIGDEIFLLTFIKNNEKVFTKSVGKIDVTDIQSSERGNYIAWNTNNPGYLYYSIDGVLFYTISCLTIFRVCMSDDGYALYGYGIDGPTNANFWIYYMSLSDASSLQWSRYFLGYDEWTVGEEGFRSANYWASREITVDNIRKMSSTFMDISRTPFSSWSFTPFFHSPRDGVAVFVFPASSSITMVNNLGNELDNVGEFAETSLNCMQLVVITTDSFGIHASIYPYFTSGYNHFPIDDMSTGYSRNKIRLKETANSKVMTVSFMTSPVETLSTPLEVDVIVLKDDYKPYSKVMIDNSLAAGFWFVFKDIVAQRLFLPDNISSLYTSNLYTMDMVLNYDLILSKYENNIAFNTGENDKMYRFKFSTSLIANYDSNNYVANYVYPDYIEGESYNIDYGRTVYPVTIYISNTSNVLMATNVTGLRYFKLALNSNVLTGTYLYQNGEAIPLLVRNGISNNIPVYIEDDLIVYYDLSSKLIYSSSTIGKVYIDDIQDGYANIFVPYIVKQFTTNVLSKNNKTYISLKRNGQLYLPKSNILEFADDVTNLIPFSQTSLGIFLENEVYELTVNDYDDAGNEIYVLNKTKLQLGCKKDSDVMLNYDGKTIFLTTLKGLSSLTYQDFVQSTEQAYTYLTEKIMSTYDKFAVSPIKLMQFKNWIFMYRQDADYFYLFDLRNASWWKWTNIGNVSQMFYDRDSLNILINGILYEYDETDNYAYTDYVGERIDWTFKSQKLHFGAPNNYKQVKSISIIANNDNANSLRYKLWFKNYRNLSNLSEIDVTEQDVDQLTTVIRKVNFIKTNAFQFAVSNDVRNPNPSKFLTPNVSIKYRVTERIR